MARTKNKKRKEVKDMRFKIHFRRECLEDVEVGDFIRPSYIKIGKESLTFYQVVNIQKTKNSYNLMVTLKDTNEKGEEINFVLAEKGRFSRWDVREKIEMVE